MRVGWASVRRRGFVELIGYVTDTLVEIKALPETRPTERDPRSAEHMSDARHPYASKNAL